MDWTGQKLGNYYVQRSIGHGGFADVYLGQHMYLKTYAAIKLLQTQLGQHDLHAFLAEARTIAGLTHPNIVRVLEFGVEEQSHTPFLVMDYSPNGTLRQRHPKQTRITLNESIAYIKQISAALHYAHDRKVIHRDVKPENMLVGQHEQVLLSDFGIAVVSQSSRYQGRQDIGGTVAYMAPEQLQGQASYASDQYALGIVLYEWLTGALPFQGSFAEIGSQHLFASPPSLQAKVPKVPLAVEQVYQKALTKDPQQRFSTIQDFAQALEVAAQGNDPTYTIQRGAPLQDQSSVPTYVRPAPGNVTGVSAQPTQRQNLAPSSPAYQQFPQSTTTTPPLLPLQPAGYAPPPFTPNGSMSNAPWQPPGQYTPQIPPRTGSNKLYLFIIAALVVLLAGAGIWGFTRQSGGNSTTTGSSGPATASTQVSHSGGNAGNQTPTQAVATPAPQPSATAADGSIPEAKTLTCGDCNDPVRVTINSINIESKNGRMVWNVTTTNVSGTNAIFYINDFYLTTTDANSQIAATGGDNVSLNAGDNHEYSLIFAFIPYKNVKYTLHAHINETWQGVDIKFDPMDFTF